MSGIASCHSKKGHHIGKNLMGYFKEIQSNNVLNKLDNSSGRYTCCPHFSSRRLAMGARSLPHVHRCVDTVSPSWPVRRAPLPLALFWLTSLSHRLQVDVWDTAGNGFNSHRGPANTRQRSVIFYYRFCCVCFLKSVTLEAREPIDWVCWSWRWRELEVVCFHAHTPGSNGRRGSEIDQKMGP